jgi:malonyl-CoA/methylmalonyl-CoA synthetase
MSETLLTVSNPYEPERRKPGTIGLPVHPGAVQIQDERGQRCPPGQIGELAIQGPSLMLGYWNAPEKTAQASRQGWFMTGDAARYDEDGYIVHVGRRSVDILKCGGYKISAREIEEAILLHPGVQEVAVVGLPDPEWGQSVAAALVLEEGQRQDQDWAAELSRFLDGSLARYKWPRRAQVVQGLPRNALGKLQKHLILKDFSG